nr:hypothetical protein BaRGS_013431 [Batillaria attramentaria]
MEIRVVWDCGTGPHSKLPVINIPAFTRPGNYGTCGADRTATVEQNGAYDRVSCLVLSLYTPQWVTEKREEGESNYCLPVYVRCNGVHDCVGHEDEADCENFTCPGFYRCRASPVCVHVDHLCDGMARCPQRDDEWLCGVKCPEGCRCHDRYLHSAADH